MTEVLSFAMTLINELPALIDAGLEVKSLIEATGKALKAMQAEARDPTPEEWHALNEHIATLRDQLHAS